MVEVEFGDLAGGHCEKERVAKSDYAHSLTCSAEAASQSGVELVPHKMVHLGFLVGFCCLGLITALLPSVRSESQHEGAP